LFKDLRLYENPNLVAENEDIAWGVSFWFWKVRVRNNAGVSEGRFGVTTKAINGGLECGTGPNVSKAKTRFEIYKKVLIAFNINEVANETGCYN
jgi:chitinase